MSIGKLNRELSVTNRSTFIPVITTQEMSQQKECGSEFYKQFMFTLDNKIWSQNFLSRVESQVKSILLAASNLIHISDWASISNARYDFIAQNCQKKLSVMHDNIIQDSSTVLSHLIIYFSMVNQMFHLKSIKYMSVALR